MLLDQQRFARPFGMDLRNDDERIVDKVLRDALGIRRFHGEIQLAFERARELRDDLDRLIAARFRHLRIDELREMSEQPQIGFDGAANSRTPDLQHNRRAIVELGAMHLRDRGRSLRTGIEIDENIERRASERLRQLGQQIVERHRRHVGVQLFEFADPIGRKKIDACRKQLPELDENGTEFLQRKPHTLGGLLFLRFRRCRPLQNLSRALQRTGYADALHDVAESMADQHRRDLTQTRKVPHRPECELKHG